MTHAESPSRPRGHWVLWWLPPVVLFIAGALLDPVSRLNSGSHAYRVQERLAFACFAAGAVYIPAMIVLRLARATLHFVRRRRAGPDEETPREQGGPPCPACGGTRFHPEASGLASCTDGRTRAFDEARCAACGEVWKRYAGQDAWREGGVAPSTNSRAEVLYAHRFPVDGRPLAKVDAAAASMDLLALRLGATPQSFEFDAGGFDRGFCVRIVTGQADGIGGGSGAGSIVVALEEQRLPGDGATDVALYVDATDMAREPIETLLDRILPALGLKRRQLSWVVDESGREFAAERIEQHRVAVEARGRADDDAPSAGS